MTQLNIAALEEIGLTRWKKGSHDRLYFNRRNAELWLYPAAQIKTTYDEWSGKLVKATRYGQSISETAFNRIVKIMSERMYIDVKENLIVLDDFDDYDLVHDVLDNLDTYGLESVSAWYADE